MIHVNNLIHVIRTQIKPRSHKTSLIVAHSPDTIGKTLSQHRYRAPGESVDTAADVFHPILRRIEECRDTVVIISGYIEGFLIINKTVTAIMPSTSCGAAAYALTYRAKSSSRKMVSTVVIINRPFPSIRLDNS